MIFCVFVSFEVTKPLSDIGTHPNSLSKSKVSTQIFNYDHQFAHYCAIYFVELIKMGKLTLVVCKFNSPNLFV